MKKLNLRKRVLLLVLAVVAAVILLGLVRSEFWSEQTPTPENEISSILARDNRTIFEPVLPGDHVTLPADFKFHPQYQHEWWNYFAKLTDNKGETYNVQWSYFRIATDERDTSGWQNPQLYVSQIVISHGSRVWKEQRIARGGIGQAGMQNRPFSLWIDNWSWRSLGTTPFPGKLAVATDKFGVNLYTQTSGPFSINGDKGFQVKHALQSIASFSFSAPFLKVKGTLNIDGKLISVSGSGWTQKEWGSGLIGEGQKGWDWFIFSLDDGRALTVSRYRHHSQTPHIFGTLSTRSGKVISLSHKDITITPNLVNRLPNGKQLPLHWFISVPSYGIELTTRAEVTNMWLPFVIPYWEGPILASGTNEGWGFMQLTGY